MHQLIGIILLIAAVVAVFYVSAHYTELLKFKVPLPTQLFQPVTIPSYNAGGSVIAPPVNNFQTQPVLEPQKSARIGSVRLQNQEVIIYSNVAGGGAVDVTGWTVKSNNGSFRIPQAQEVYSFGGVQGDVNLRSGNQLHIYSTVATKGNFRLNKCLGYIEDVSPFSPSLPKNCPSIPRSEISGFSGACQNYVNSLRSCENPSANPPIPLDDDSCRPFLRELNYSGCVSKYGNDADFLQNEWRVWLGNVANIFDPLHDKIQLLDRNGKMVDEYIY